MKFIFLILFLLPYCAYAEVDYFILSKKKKCFVKSYHDKKFFDVDAKRFYSTKIFSRPHKKNDRYSVFKYKNQIYVTLTSCLNPMIIAHGDYDNLIDSEPDENYENLNKAATSYKLANGLQFNENKYYVELDAGTISISDKSPVNSDYNDLDGTYGTDTLDFHKPLDSKYKAKSSFSIGAGYQLDEGRFLALKLKHFSGEKVDIVPVSITNLGINGESEFKYEDTFTSFLIGQKFFFWPHYQLKPVLSLFLGVNHITTEATLPTEPEIKLNLESYGVSAMVEAGFEFLFTPNLGISLTGGYEYLGARTFKLKKEDEVVNEGYKSKLSYSNTFINGGIRIYFR